MPQAVWKGAVVADSDDTLVVEGNHYFPSESVRWEFFVNSPTTSRCFWKGQAHYLTLAIDDDVNVDAAWYYPKPWPLARKIVDHVAFWRGVQIRT